MILSWAARPLGLTTRVLRSDGWPRLVSLLAIVNISITIALATTIGAVVDGAWNLTDGGIGLSRHLGAWTIIVTDPLILISTAYAYLRFRATIARLTESVPRAKRAGFHHLTTDLTRMIQGRDQGVYLYIFLVIFGLLCWVANVYKTTWPKIYYLHDVFDSAAHMHGFVAYKVCLFVSWVGIYPACGYLVLMISWCSWRLLQRSRKGHLLSLRVTHPDNCYGLRSLGTLSISLLIPFLLAYMVIFSLLITHGVYDAALAPLAAITIIVLAASYLTILPAFFLLRDARSATYDALLRGLSARHRAEKSDRDDFTMLRLCYVSTQTTPYSTNARLVANSLRLIPVATLLLNLARQWHL